MMGELFQKVLDMSLIGCYSILIVMAVRLLLSRFERKFTYYLWFVVFMNLCIPFSFQGVFSLIPGFVAEFSISDAVEDALGSRVQGESDAVIIPTVPDGVQGTEGNYDSVPGNPGGADYLPQALVEDTTPQTINIASGVWLAGIAVLLVWSLAGMLRLKKQISRDNWIRFSSKQGIAEVADLDTPFLWGIFSPMIYLPTDLEPEEMRYIVAHEQYHKKRRDYLIKIAVFLVAAIHWFNPLVWAAYTLFCRDMEISCDEAVLLEFKDNIRKQYAGSLLKYAARQSGFVLSPITFGEPAVKTRIKNVLRFKKRGIVISVLTVICVAGVAAGLVLRPFAEEKIPQEASGQNTAESELLNMSAGVDEMLTNDTSDLAAATEETQEGSDTTVLTVMKEGLPEEIPATLYKGEGYSIYVADGVWDNYAPDAWQAKVNEQVGFSISNYEGLNKSQVERLLTAQGYVVENGELWWQSFPGDSMFSKMYRTICYETESDVWTFNFSYPPGEAEEGWLPELRTMANTFAVDAGYDVGAHTAKAVMPEGEQLQLYEVTYTDRRSRDWYSRDREEMKGYYIYDEITVSHVTDTTFDFTVTWSDPETGETGTIIPNSTAYINEDQTSATYTGEDYTLTFDFSYMYNPLPVVLYIRLWGADELEGLLFYNNNIPGYEAE